MTTGEFIETIVLYGGLLALEGDQVHYDLAGDAAPLVPELIARREDVKRLLKQRNQVPPIPSGFTLVSWNPKPAPVIIEKVSIVSDATTFAYEKLHHLAAAAADPTWRHIIPTLLDQLSQIGLVLTDKQEYQE